MSSRNHNSGRLRSTSPFSIPKFYGPTKHLHNKKKKKKNKQQKIKTPPDSNSNHNSNSANPNKADISPAETDVRGTAVEEEDEEYAKGFLRGNPNHLQTFFLVSNNFHSNLFFSVLVLTKEYQKLEEPNKRPIVITDEVYFMMDDKTKDIRN